MTLKASGMLHNLANIQYLCMIVSAEVLRQFDTLSSDVESSTPLILEAIVLRLGMYFFPVNAMSKKNCAMCRKIRNPYGLKVRCYAARLVGLKKYLASFPGSKMTGKSVMTDSNEFLLNIMPNSWINKAYV